jgi:heme/copper-type cytochrome/quinol oxidase subunit 2
MEPDEQFTHKNKKLSRSLIDWDPVYWERTGNRYSLRVSRLFLIILILAIVVLFAFAYTVLYYDGLKSQEWATPKVKQSTPTR